MLDGPGLDRAGLAAWRRLGQRGECESVSARQATLPAKGEECHLHVHGRRPVAVGVVRLETGTGPAQRRRHPRVVHQGQAVRLHEQQFQGPEKTAWPGETISAARTERHVVQREHPAHRRHCRRDDDVSHLQDEPVQPRAGEAVHEYRHRDFWAAQHGRVGDVWHRQRIAKSAGIRGTALRSTGTPRRGGQLGEWVSADHVSRGAAAGLGRPDP